MTARYATRDVLLGYLRTAGEPRVLTAIIKHMRCHKVSPGATRTQLWRLERTGVVDRLEGKQFQIRPGA